MCNLVKKCDTKLVPKRVQLKATQSSRETKLVYYINSGVTANQQNK
jgi:hypothetical protein